ncbi:MAG: S41 family peptidase [Cyclobacteriaceae bacterium]
MYTVLKSIVSLCLILSCICGSYAQSRSGRHKADFEILTGALLTTHPNLYRSTPKAKFNEVLDSLRETMNDELSAVQFFRAASRVFSMIKEGHSRVSPSRELIAEMQDKALFPFDVWLLDDRLVVRATRDSSYEDMVSSEITSINGRPVNDIIQCLVGLAGSSSGRDNHQGLIQSLSLYNNFAQAYYYFVDTTNTFQLGYQKRGETESQIMQVRGVAGQIKDDDYLKLPAEREAPVTTEINIKENYALLKVTTFAWWTGKYSIKEYKKVFKEFFKKVSDHGLEHLIIDVRDNRGGEELLGVDILTYLIPYAFTPYEYIQTSSLEYSSLKSLPEFEGDTKFNTRDYVENESGFQKKDDPILKTFDPKAKYAFRGQVYVLGNGRSWSAASTFLSWTKTHKAGIYVGQEGGGAFTTVDGRQMVKFTLPYSGLRVSYPIWSMKLNTSNGSPHSGPIPDVEIQKTPAQLLNGTDTEIEYVLRQIKASTQINP